MDQWKALCYLQKGQRRDWASHCIANHRPSPPSDRWSLIAGDCIHNLRSALDHLVYALAIRDSGKNPPPNEGNLQFPIVTKPEKWPDSRDRRLSPLNPTSQAKIERVQPYNRKHKYLGPLLALLGQLDIADKHRLLTVTSWHTVGGDVRMQCDDPPPSVYRRKTPIQSGTEDIMFFETTDSNVSYDYDPEFDITISHSQGPSGEHVSSLKYILESLVVEVKDVVNLIVL